MKLTAEQFLNMPRKAVTLMGMSGVGKTWLGCRLAEWGWAHYSCDYLIGTKYLGDALEKTLRIQNTLGVDNLELLSTFVGQLGNPEKGGLPLAEFQERQRLYVEAERQSITDVGRAIEHSMADFVCDSTGSLCELMDEDLYKVLGAQTLYVYIKASPEEEAAVMQRAIDYPKPIYLPPKQFLKWLREYMDLQGLKSDREIDPDDFSRWVFPLLFKARLPKYQRLADLYGVTVSSESFRNLGSAEDFVKIVAEAL